ncbi:MAG TPA: class I SAM-dependent methyltransferase [Longimicrobiales bacterium]|nr:class I SAM-dependent methyltransferase [Longimicrobiales bacterium]
MGCPLCGGNDVGRFELDYYRCAACELTFLDPALRPDPAAERARYDEHRNDPHDVGYRTFLQRLAGPLTEIVPPGTRGLDYGSGPGPTLSLMLAEAGYDVALYDPFYADDASVLMDSYDFITCTEVAEHFFNPGAEFERLAGMLRPGGVLAVMTEPLHDDVDFPRWHYRRDPTHVCFYRPATMEWIAQRYGWRMVQPSLRVTLFVDVRAT